MFVMMSLCRKPPQPRFNLERAITEAFLKIGIETQDRAAQELGISAVLYGKQIKSEEHLSLQRLLLIDDARFWVSLLASISEHKCASLTVDSGHLRRDVMCLLVEVNKFAVQMLKAESSTAERKRA